ncbi:hypothetical protein GGS23DRAFT_557146 [Durotheca rogersii]|uniref:uncharacterized protein n=1 Tax=Durotheca rogersii TaxID=419775 RepID=UPI00221F0BE7|nr:uncharacterized protein GGS23DRAFT_557146 [Durotheca rogersii]KAI5864999.1 hypothetical protein GGS23DRAFT_557146 [Durotheca rogersii]
MTLVDLYRQFLTAPNSSQLAAEAALHYITTTTSYKGAEDIIKHIDTSAKQLKKDEADFLTAIEGHNAIAVEIKTTLEFVTSGGAYLPGLDDNFLADRTVHLAITHIVDFAPDGKISQIRRTWDQGSLLKQLDIIGKSGRNWPIRDSKEQIKIIEACVKLSSDASADSDFSSLSARARGDSTNILRDPHASLALFAPREESSESIAAVVSPRGGARPRQRDFTEILGDEPVDNTEEQSASPSKVIAPKAGAGKGFQPSRLFDETDAFAEEANSPEASPSRFYRPNPKKFSHFDFGDGSDPRDVPEPIGPTTKKTKHTSQWSFDDFVTPQKPKPTKGLRHQEVRHWATDNDQAQENHQTKTAAPAKPRRDAETHFEFVDDGVPNGEPRATRPRGATQNNELGLYKNNLYSEEGNEASSTGEPQPLGAITNLKDRGRDFEAHWDMTDNSPAHKTPKAPVGDDRKKAVKMMDANWSSYDESPAQKENKPTMVHSRSKVDGERGIHIAGDGMGGGKGSNRNWLFGDEDHSPTTNPATGRKATAGKSQGFNWDF